MTRRLLATYLILTALVLALLEVPLGLALARSQRSDLAHRLRLDAQSGAEAAERILDGPADLRASELDQLALDYVRARPGGRLLVVGPSGTILADSQAGSDDAADAAATRPELAQALRGQVAEGTRHSVTLGSTLRYVAVPIGALSDVLGAVRVSYPSDVVERQVHRTWWTLVGLSALVLAAISVVGWVLARTVSTPLQRVAETARRLGSGELTARTDDAGGPPEVRALAHDLDETAARIEALVSAQRAFAGDAGHQLRTPLQALGLRLELLEGHVGPEAEEDLAAAGAEAARLGTLVEALLDLASQTPSAGTADPAEVVAQRLVALEPLALARGITVTSEVPGGLHAAVGSPALGSVLDVLLANALDASPDGGDVLVTGRATLDVIEVHVLDRGPGPGAGLPVGPRLGGSGRGLSVAARLLAPVGGSVVLLSRTGGGADAVVRLPARDIVAG